MSELEPSPATPAATRNQQPILEVLRGVLPPYGTVLEIASGTGQHVVHFAAALPGLEWQPSDADPERCASIAARCARAGLGNLRPPLALDVHAEPWDLAGPYDAVVCINLIHIAPLSATAALVRGARRALRRDNCAALFLYGPFLRAGHHTAASNAAFDRRLRAENPAWGVRDLSEVTRLAAEQGFAEPTVVAMPVNNLSVIFTLGSRAPG